jgi:tyrosyl-tRNA synthetase
MENILQTLKDRGLIAQESHDGKVAQYLESGSRTFYVGFDPTADSLHVGHLAAIMAMYRLVHAGHKAICLLGGGTAMIGDPSGKTEMRKLMTPELLESNRLGLTKQMSHLLKIENVDFVNNADWLLPLNYLNFMRDYGVHFKVNEMIKNEIYKGRLDREEGLTVFELNYLLLQSYDYLHLYRTQDCTIQLGGSDQWANILGGVDLVKKCEGKEVYALTWPLVARSDGKKMGKSESGTVWLDETKTSVYELYQWWINVPDADVSKFLKIFTMLELDEIEKIVVNNIIEAKKTLAFEVTRFVHGEEKAWEAKEQSESLFEKGDFENAPAVEIDASLVAGENVNLLEILTSTNILESKSKAREMISSGAISVNDEKIGEFEIQNPFKQNKDFVVRVGKKKYYKIIVK